MADREAQQKLYAYGEMSNKVQQASRSQRRIRSEEGTGEVESLRNRNDIGRMGDRIASSSVGDDKASKRPAELKEIMDRANKKRQKREQASGGNSDGKKRRSGESILVSSGGQSILDMSALDGYQPSHAGSRASYESLLVSYFSKVYSIQMHRKILLTLISSFHLKECD